ncbi:MAG: SDR family oxidoreductase [Phycisphaerales bacterium]
MLKPLPMTVAVTGATGFVGRHTVRALAARGHRVRALARSLEKLRAVLPDLPPNVEVVQGEVFDRAAMNDLCRGVGAVVHTIGIRKEVFPKSTFERMHIAATRLTIDAAASAGARRFVLVSALGVRPEGPTAYQQSKHAAENLVRSSGLDWTIFRPSLIHGEDGEFMQMVKAWVLGRMTPHFFIPYFVRVEGKPPAPPKLVAAEMAPVWVRDVAGAIAASLETDRAVGEVYTLTGPETMRWPELLRHIQDSLPASKESKKRLIPIPGRLGWAQAIGAKALGLANALPFGPSEPLLAMEDSVSNCSKAADHLGFNPAPFRARVREYAGRV